MREQDDGGYEVSAGAGSKVRVMSQWWLVVLAPSARTGRHYITREGKWSPCLLQAGLFDREDAESASENRGGSARRADDVIRSLELPMASTETLRGPMGSGRKGDYEVLGPVRTMVDMLEGSPMAAALRVGQDTGGKT